MRSRAIAIVTAFLALILSACASSSTSTSSPVHLVISADERVLPFVNTGELQELTELALHKYAAKAGEATVTIRLDSLVKTTQPTPGVVVMSQPSDGHRVPIVSPEPWNEPGQPMVGARNTIFVPTYNSPMQEAVLGTYTITDASGAILEQKPITFRPYYRGSSFDRMEQFAAVTHVAKRVAALRKR